MSNRRNGRASVVWDVVHLAGQLRDAVHQNKIFPGLVRSWDKEVTQRYELGDDIGSGSIGSVSTVTCKDDDSGEPRMYALKTMISFEVTEEERKEFRNELQLLRRLDHPHIVQIFEIYTVNSRDLYIMDYCSLGTLSSAKYEWTEARVVTVVAIPLLQALAYLRTQGVCHCDLKLENLMLTHGPNQKRPHLKLIDFGLSKRITQDEGTNHAVIKKKEPLVGTLYAMAPEVYFNRAYSHKADVWGVGVVIFVLLTQQYPFLKEPSELQAKSKVQAFRQAHLDLDQHRLRHVSVTCKEILRLAMTRDPAERPSASELLQFGCSRWQEALRESEVPVESDTFPIVLRRSLQVYARLLEVQRTVLRALAFCLDKSQHVGVDVAQAYLTLGSRGEGHASFEAFKKMWESSGASESSNTEAEQIFAALDPDGSGIVSYTAFVAACLPACHAFSGNASVPLPTDVRSAFIVLAPSTHLRIEDIVALSSKGALRGDERLKDVACINGIASPSAGEEWPGMDRWTLGEFHTAVRWMLSSCGSLMNDDEGKFASGDMAGSHVSHDQITIAFNSAAAQEGTTPPQAQTQDRYTSEFEQNSIVEQDGEEIQIHADAGLPADELTKVPSADMMELERPPVVGGI